MQNYQIFKKIKLFSGFLKKYLINYTRYCLLYLYRLLIQEKKLNCQFYKTSEVIKLIDQGKSILRIGDGEIGLLRGRSILYQVYSPEIKHEFLKLIKNYNFNSDYILAIPIFINYTNKELDALPNPNEDKSKKLCWLPLKISYEMIFNKNIKYIDAHLFYRFAENQKVVSHVLSLDKTFVFISDEKSIEELKKIKNDLNISQKIKFFITTPNQNSFEERQRIIQEIKDISQKNNLNRDNSLIIFKGGLVKSIIAELSKDYQIIDVGYSFTSYLRKEGLDYLI